jgi:phosphoribosylaminoimidazole-succinocarboxamide synthase
MIVKKVKRIAVECVVRGYLAGSAGRSIKSTGPSAAKPCPRFAGKPGAGKTVFTPTTKADAGHDEPITIKEIIKMLGPDVTKELEEKSLELYAPAREYAKGKGIIIADTKFEFGIDNGRLTLIDEVLTPDSSRFWDVDLYQPGRSQASFDKQPLRDWLAASGWNKEPPGPMLPDDIVAATSQRYVQAYERLTGRHLALLE